MRGTRIPHKFGLVQYNIILEFVRDLKPFPTSISFLNKSQGPAKLTQPKNKDLDQGADTIDYATQISDIFRSHEGCVHRYHVNLNSV